jgi:hypothetical protein
VDRFISKDEVNSTIYLVEAGKETKIMEMTYKRKK